jgi:RNA polymerase sigma-70 factor (ECF subfamily)
VTPSNPHSDLDLIRQIRSGDVESFSSLFRLYYQPLCFFALRYLRDVQDSEGIVQDVFVRLWMSRETLDIRSSLRSYLYVSVRNACLNQIKHDEFSAPLDEEQDRPDDATAQPDHQLQSAELAEAVELAIKSLPPRSRQILTMAKYDRLSYQEIAEVLHISVNTVKTQLQRAVKSLGKTLKYLQFLLAFLRWW